MKPLHRQATKDLTQEEVIEKVLKSNKKLFPETIQEVMEYEAKYGSTDITLPESLQNPTFIYTMPQLDSVSFQTDAIISAVAARNEGIELTPEIKKRMGIDRKNARASMKKSKGK